jgi:formamidopyrimidine-DNA glycosylase
MPELPEVEVARRQLARWAEGRVLSAVRIEDPGVVRPRWSTRPSDGLVDGAERLAPIVGVVAPAPIRHGKRLGWELGPVGLGIHLGMTGRLMRVAGDAVPPHGRFAVRVEGDWLWLEDSRRFGCVVPVASGSLRALLTDGLGPDALLEPPDGPGLQRACGGRRPIKVALMDQSKLAGVGNIQAVEALFLARIAPARRADTLSADEWAALARAIPAQLARTIGFTDADEVQYVTRGGDNPFSVYGRAEQACPRCGAPIATDRHSGRATFWCPGCQT